MTYLSVIIPVHNETHRLARCIEQMDAYLDAHYSTEVLLVENGSTDDTLALAHTLTNNSRHGIRYRVLSTGARGKWRAIALGMQHARGRWRYMADCDWSTPPDVIDGLILNAQAQGAHLIACQRTDYDGARGIMHVAFAALTWGIIPHVPDTQCGYKLFSDACARDVFRALTTNGLAGDVEALALAHHMGYTIMPMPVPWVHEPRSVIRPWRDAPAMAAEVLRIRARLRSVPRRAAVTS